MNEAWTLTDTAINVTVPFQKVNKETRTVAGFATLDNVDTHGDVVDADASIRAFQRFRGAVREMHQPLAVGKVIDFQTQEFTDPDDPEVSYKGVFVTAYVSKGAQDTWEKVLDGTLSGFSIGGVIKKKELGKSGDSTFNIIKEYDLIELSLVDNPANQLANVFSITKMADDTTMATGFAVDTKVKNVLYNREDDVVILSDDENRDGFENIGWVEDNEDATTKMQGVVSDYKKKYLDGSLDNKVEQVRSAWYKQFNQNYEGDEFLISVFDGFVITRAGDSTYRYTYSLEDNNYNFGQRAEVEVTTQISEKSATATLDKDGNLTFSSGKLQSSETSSLEKNEGGANMATENENVEETVDEEVESPEEEVETAEKAAAIDEVAPTVEVDVEAIVAKAVDAAVAAVTEKSADSEEEKEDDPVAKALEGLTAKIDELTTKTASVEERLDKVEGEGAVKKSADNVVENDDDEDDEDDIWKGGFLGAGALTK